MRAEMKESVERRSPALTSVSNIVNKVPTWVSSRHLRRSNHKRLAYQSSASGAGSEIGTGPMTEISFFVHRRTTFRS